MYRVNNIYIIDKLTRDIYIGRNDTYIGQNDVCICDDDICIMIPHLRSLQPNEKNAATR